MPPLHNKKMNYANKINAGRTLVFLDLETTGLSSSGDRIIEIGAIKVKDNKVIDTFHSLVIPGIPVPFNIQKLTGITNEEINKKGKILDEIKPAFLKFIGNNPIVGHNISFDRDFLLASGLKLENQFLDTCELSCILFPTFSHHSLNFFIKKFKIREKEVHRALADCEDTYKLWLALFNSLEKKDLSLIQKINQLMEPTEWVFKEIFRDMGKIMIADKLRPEEDITDTEISLKKEIVPYNPEEKIPLNIPEIISNFEKKGMLSKYLPDYESRIQQREMAEMVCKVLNEDKHLFIEVGTGTGKSLAYLIPSIHWAVNNHIKVVVSTNTKNLQDQLWNKEIPFLNKNLNVGFSSALVKGRENYICLRKWQKLYEEPVSLFYNDRMALLYFLAWRYRTKEGLLENISAWYSNKFPRTKEIDEQIRSEKDTCLNKLCAFRHNCFYQKMKKTAYSADIIISNHALTLSPPQWFPSFWHLILDEGHNVEDAATDLFTKEVSNVELLKLFSWMYSGKKESRSRLGFIWGVVQKEKDFKNREKVFALREKITFLIGEIRRGTLVKFPELFFSIMDEKKNDEMSGVKKLLTLKEIKKKKNWGNLKTVWENLIFEMAELEKLLSDLENIFEKSELDELEKKEITGTINFISKNVVEIKDILNFILKEESENYVYWGGKVERDEQLPIWYIKAAPVNVGEFLKDLYEKKASIIFTSATLTVADKFDFFIQRLGCDVLPPGKILTKVLGSPFDYKEKVILGIPKNFPSYNYLYPEGFVLDLSDGIEKIAISVRGKILVLFNSLSRMREIYKRIKPKLESENIMILCQYIDGSRSSLVERTKNTDGDVLLFGTKSFQEGIDISGLNGVIIEKIPFPNPNDPVIQGRKEYFENNNCNPWNEYLIPLTTIALKQSFGRLMRKKTDKGFIIIFDSRLHNDYREMRQSLPSCKEIFQSLENFHQSIKNYFV